jgi:hypothetical protein
MGKRGPKPKGKVVIKWSSNLAYAIGLLTTDGCLSPSGRHIVLVSKDREQLENFMIALNIKISIGKTRSGYTGKTTTRIQFGDIVFYRFLLDIGLTQNKTRTIGAIKIPRKYFFDFLRGHFDGDGCAYSYFDPRWKSSFMFYTTFVSASERHILWLQKEIFRQLGIKGHITRDGRKLTIQLKFAKAGSMKLFHKMYPNKNTLCLSRKRLKIEKMLSIVGERL